MVLHLSLLADITNQLGTHETWVGVLFVTLRILSFNSLDRNVDCITNRVRLRAVLLDVCDFIGSLTSQHFKFVRVVTKKVACVL